jgi:ribonuclease HI
LLFADDSLLFFKATVAQANRVRLVLDSYEKSTGQLINPGKCSIMFGKTCPQEVRDEVMTVLQLTTEAFDTKYLGLPTPDGKINKEKLQSIQAKLGKRLIGYEDNFMTQAAKEVLIKAVAQALPVYLMGVFKLPYGLCDELTKMIRNFWWGAENGQRKAHWIAWEKLLRPKDRGGIGFKDLRLFNQALLARQAWRLIQFPESLCAQLLKAKYYPSGNLIDTVFAGNASSTWQAIEYGLQLLKKGLIWRVGNGAQIRAWRDPWIPRGDYKAVAPRRCCRYRWVSDFLRPDGTWDEQRVAHFFAAEDATEILKIKASTRNDADFLAWAPEKQGIYSVRSAYRLALEEQMQMRGLESTSTRPQGERPIWQMIWKCPVPPKVQHLAWKIGCNALATQVNKHRRGIRTPPTCLICGQEDEDTFHVFVRCPHARDLWNAMRETWDIPADESLCNTGVEWLLHLIPDLSEMQRAKTFLLLWRIWYVHNEITHQKQAPPVEGSRRFLLGYLESLLLIKQHPEMDLAKGKMVVSYDSGFKRDKDVENGRQKPCKKWFPPRPGEVKLNVDGSWSSQGTAGAGMIIRDHTGAVIVAACKSLQACQDATEAELEALEEGMKLALLWTTRPVVVETDCATAVQLIKGSTPNSSVYAFQVLRIRDLFKERECRCVKIDRTANSASHGLAQLGRIQARTQVWAGQFPEEIAEAIASDCNSISV